MSLPIALQLYTVRDRLKNDPEGTLKEVARIGYRYIEGGLLRHLGPQGSRKFLDSLGLRSISSLPGHEALRDRLDQLLEEARIMGYAFLGVGWLAEPMRTVEGFTTVARILAQVQPRLQKEGLVGVYHNHSFEYAPLNGGRKGLDILMAEPAVQFELDIYWAQHGGDDPLERMKRLAGRVPVLHVKDMAPGPERQFTEVGRGIIDIPAIVRTAPTCGVRYLVVEQDSNFINGDPLQSAAISYDNLRRMLK